MGNRRRRRPGRVGCRVVEGADHPSRPRTGNVACFMPCQLTRRSRAKTEFSTHPQPSAIFYTLTPYVYVSYRMKIHLTRCRASQTLVL